MSICVNATFVMPEISELAQRLSKKTEESFICWNEALKKGMMLATATGIDPDAFLMIVNNSVKSSQFLLIMESLNGYSRENPYGMNAFNFLVSYTSRSNYSLKDWVEVLDYFYEWLAKNCRQASLETILGYVWSCIGNRNFIELSNCGLLEIVDKVLGTYGFQD